MLHPERRPLESFLSKAYRDSLEKRRKSAARLASRMPAPSSERTKKIRGQWKNFRQGLTSAGVSKALDVELRRMAWEKCAFCETPAPRTIEHLDPVSVAPAKAFDWDNLLPCCDSCNRIRGDAVTTSPFDPTRHDPFEHLGWDEYGAFMVNPASALRGIVTATVDMYELWRFNDARRNAVVALKAYLAVLADPTSEPTYKVFDALFLALQGRTEYRGAVRQYLLKPPTPDDEVVLDAALARWPGIREAARSWLRPPATTAARWGAT